MSDTPEEVSAPLMANFQKCAFWHALRSALAIYTEPESADKVNLIVSKTTV